MTPVPPLDMKTLLELFRIERSSPEEALLRRTITGLIRDFPLPARKITDKENLRIIDENYLPRLKENHADILVNYQQTFTEERHTLDQVLRAMISFVRSFLKQRETKESANRILIPQEAAARTDNSQTAPPETTTRMSDDGTRGQTEASTIGDANTVDVSRSLPTNTIRGIDIVSISSTGPVIATMDRNFRTSTTIPPRVGGPITESRQLLSRQNDDMVSMGSNERKRKQRAYSINSDSSAGKEEIKTVSNRAKDIGSRVQSACVAPQGNQHSQSSKPKPNVRAYNAPKPIIRIASSSQAKRQIYCIEDETTASRLKTLGFKITSSDSKSTTQDGTMKSDSQNVIDGRATASRSFIPTGPRNFKTGATSRQSFFAKARNRGAKNSTPSRQVDNTVPGNRRGQFRPSTRYSEPRVGDAENSNMKASQPARSDNVSQISSMLSKDVRKLSFNDDFTRDSKYDAGAIKKESDVDVENIMSKWTSGSRPDTIRSKKQNTQVKSEIERRRSYPNYSPRSNLPKRPSPPSKLNTSVRAGDSIAYSGPTTSDLEASSKAIDTASYSMGSGADTRSDNVMSESGTEKSHGTSRENFVSFGQESRPSIQSQSSITKIDGEPQNSVQTKKRRQDDDQHGRPSQVRKLNEASTMEDRDHQPREVDIKERYHHREGDQDGAHNQGDYWRPSYSDHKRKGKWANYESHRTSDDR